MITWKLDIAGTVKTLAEWGVEGVTLQRVNLAGDTLTFSAPRATYATAALCVFGASVRLLRSENSVDTVWFTGTNQTIPSTATAESGFDQYTILSPWRWLAQNVFQQPWFGGTVYTSHILLLGTAGNNIKAVLDYAIASGAPLAYVPADLALLAVTPPADEFTEKTCAQVILQNLQFAPDVVVYFNYTTSPNPTLRFQRRSELLAVDLRMADFADTTRQAVAAVSITPRPDLQIPSAKINIEVIEEIDGVQHLVPGVEIYPAGATGREDGALNATLTVQGRTIQNVFGEIETAAIDVTSLDWWKLHVPALADSRLTVIAGPQSPSAVDVEGNPAAPLPNELIEGQIAPWMENDGVPVEWRKVTLKAKFAVQYDKDGETLRLEDEKEFTIDLVTTDAPEGISSYSAVASADSGDPVPVGLAQYLHTSLSELHYQAAISLVQAECDAVVNLGHVVNLFGAKAGHQTMRALVQEVVFSIDDGSTRITCGPPRQLGLSDLLALLQRFRVRRRWTNPDTQDTGEIGGGGGDLALGKATPNNSSSPGESTPQTFSAYFHPTTTKVSLDALNTEVKVTNGGTPYSRMGLQEFRTVSATRNTVLSPDELRLAHSGGATILLALADAAGRNIQLREVNVCVKVNGVDTTRKMLVLASDAY